MDCYVGIDVGTTNTKAAAYSLDGTLLAYRSEPTKTSRPAPEMSEFNPADIWNGVSNCLKAITREISPNKIKTIGISSMAETGLPLDINGEALYPFIAWYDHRSVKQSIELENRIGRKRIYSITGQVPSGKYGICKLLWIKDNLPGIFDRTAHWLSVEDWIIYRLTGVFATDYSIAARTMAFDIRRMTWSREILSASEIPSSIFPQAYPGGTAVGRVSAGIAEELGLNSGITVVTGGHDHACASIGINILEDGAVLDSMGTAEVAMIAVPGILPEDWAYARYYSIYPHCGSKMYRVLSSNQSCGISIDWYLGTIGRDILIEAERTGRSRYDIMFERAEREVSHIGGLYFFPFIRGSIENRSVKGAFLGITDGHRTGDFINALVEGLCRELKIQLDGYEELLLGKFGKLRVVGGLTKSDYILGKKAAISGRRVEVPVNREAACYGAAILGAVGADAIKLSDLSGIYRCGRRYEPGKGVFDDERAFAGYLEMRRRLMETYY